MQPRKESTSFSLRRRIKDLKTKSKKSKHKKLLEEKKRLFQYKGNSFPLVNPFLFISTMTPQPSFLNVSIRNPNYKGVNPLITSPCPTIFLWTLLYIIYS